MKLQKIQSLCKSAKRIIIFNNGNVQWISDGYCLYPLFNLPRLNRDNVFALFDIPADKQANIFFDERDELPAGISFLDHDEGEILLAPEKYSIYAYGRFLQAIRGSGGAMLVDERYLSPLDDAIELYERRREPGLPYIVAKEGMFLAGVILPFEATSELAEWLVNTGEQVMINVENTERLKAASLMKNNKNSTII